MTHPLDPARWSEVERVFHAVVDLSAAEQSQRLAHIGATDPELRQLVERMIAAEAQLGARLVRLESVLAPQPVERLNPGDDVHQLTGRTVSHFRILEPMARGGMGIVYRAEDVDLGRDVALKFPLPDRQLDRSSRERFRNEARAAAALDHPNICSVYEVGDTAEGQLFIAMPLYEGETLRDRIARAGSLPIDDVVGFARQIARGLESAHQKGIIHRDLKPANVMVLPDGTIRILDFGVAKVQELTLTTGDKLLGTVSYMAPEQIRGEPVDARTDLWSLGVMLFEMVTGMRPFAGSHEITVAHAILNSEPPSASVSRTGVPPVLDALITALLQKDPAKRPDAAGQVVAGLDALQQGAPDNLVTLNRGVQPPRRFGTAGRRILGGGAVASVVLVALFTIRGEHVASIFPLTRDTSRASSIAVLPFENASADRAYDHLAEGISDELTGMLGTVEGLTVARRLSSTRPDGATDAASIGADVGASALLSGAIQSKDGRLRVTAALVDARSRRELWKETYDSTVGELFVVQDQIAKGVTTALGLRGARAGEHTERRRTQSSNAYDLYMRGRHSWRTRTREGLENAIVHYEQAIERDPGFALAYAGLAEAYVNLSNYGHRPPAQSLALARVAADRALALDPDFAEAHASRGYVLAANLEFVDAERAFQRALALNPSYMWARHYYTLLLLMAGRTDDARVQNRAALSLDPLSLPANATRGIILSQQGHYTEARRELQRAQALAPELPLTLFYLGALLASQGEYEEGARALERANESAPGFPGVAGALAYVYQRTGRKTAADAIVSALEQRTHDARSLANLAFAFGVLGHLDKAFPLLERVSWDVPSVIELRADPLLEPLRHDPRYSRLLQRIGVAPK